MKNVKLDDGKVDAKRITITRTHGHPWISYTDQEKVFVLKVGRRVFFTQENDYDCKNVAFANLALGAKTAARSFQKALDGERVTFENVVSGYASHGDGSLTLAPGKRGSVEFIAPCGATGYLTKREAEKLVEYLNTL